MNDFEEGYRFFEKSTCVTAGCEAGSAYVASVQREIDALITDLRSFKGYQTNPSQLKGDIAEFWHAGTFNIDAAVKGSDHRVTVDRSHGLGSADISSNFGKSFGLKYYSDGASSAKQQAKSIFERFQEYRSNGGRKTLEEYLMENGIPDNAVLTDPLYSGQIRIIPKEQLADAIEWLKRKIAKESAARPEQVKRYKETLALLQDKLTDNEGNRSIPLSNKDADTLAELAKNDDIDPEDWGLTTEQVMKYQYILKQSLRAGLSAATISMVLKTAPEVYKAICFLIQNGYINAEQFKKIGFAAVSGSAEGFIRGTVSAALTSCCTSGLWGSALKSIDPSVIGAVSVITMNMIQNSMLVACKKMTREELFQNLARDIFVSGCSLSLGLVSQYLIKIPVLGYMLGSFVGSVVGSFLYTASERIAISFCVDSGCTLFGLVEQNYRLPDEVLREIGLDLFEYEKYSYQEFCYNRFGYNRFSFYKSGYKTIGISILRRGVIGVAKIGYIQKS